MENSVDSVTVHSNSPDREFGTKGNSIIQILCNCAKGLWESCFGASPAI